MMRYHRVNTLDTQAEGREAILSLPLLAAIKELLATPETIASTLTGQTHQEKTQQRILLQKEEKGTIIFYTDTRMAALRSRSGGLKSRWGKATTSSAFTISRIVMQHVLTLAREMISYSSTVFLLPEAHASMEETGLILFRSNI